MKAFKFTDSDGYYYICSGNNDQEARDYLLEKSEMYLVHVEEVPESEWDAKTIAIYEDNDFETEPFFCSIRECIELDAPTLICTNNPEWIS